MNATQSEGKTSTENGTDDENPSVETQFWQHFAELIRETDSDKKGCYEIEATDGDEMQTCAVADCWHETTNGTEALALVFPLQKTDPMPVESHAVGVSVGHCELTTTVAKTKYSNDLLTVWLTEPQVAARRIPGGPPTREHLEYLGA